MYDHLEVRDGTDENAPILAMLCGFSPPNPVKSTSNKIYIKFFSDDSVMKRGFSLKFLKGIACIAVSDIIFTAFLLSLFTVHA